PGHRKIPLCPVWFRKIATSYIRLDFGKTENRRRDLPLSGDKPDALTHPLPLMVRRAEPVVPGRTGESTSAFPLASREERPVLCTDEAFAGLGWSTGRRFSRQRPGVSKRFLRPMFPP